MERNNKILRLMTGMAICASLISNTSHAQEEPGFGEITSRMDSEFEKKIKELGTSKGIGYTPYLRWKYFWLERLGEHGKFSTYESVMNVRAKSAYVDETSCTSDADWTPVGPTNFPANGNSQRGVGRVDWVKMHPNYDNLSNFTVYTGGRCGLWRSTDNGLNWNHLGSDKFASWGTSDVVVKPVVGAPDWLMTNTGTGIRELMGLPTNMNSNCIGLRRSFDGGTTWELINLEAAPWNISDRRKVSEMIVDPSNPNRVYVVVNYFGWSSALLHANHPNIATTGNNNDNWHGQVYVSDNFGTNWSRIFDGEYVSDIEFAPDNSNEFYISGHSLYKGLRSGTNYTFTPITQQLTGLNFLLAWNNGHAEGLEIEVSADNPNALYVHGYGNGTFQGLWYSNNRGASFVRRINPSAMTPSQASGISMVGLTHQRIDLEVSQLDENRIFLVGLNYIYSADGGMTWNTTAVHADVNDLEISNGDELFMANDAGVYRSLNDGVTFTPLCNGLNISEVYSIGMSKRTNPNVPEVLEAGMLDVTCMTYTSNGWIQPAGVYGDGMTCIVDYQDPSIVYNSAQLGLAVRRSTDSGQSFGGYNYGGAGNWVTPLMLAPSDHHLLFYGKHDLVSHHAASGVTEYHEISPSIPSNYYISAMDISRSDSLVMYVAYPQGNPQSTMQNFWEDPNMYMTEQIWVTQNGGTTWTDITPPILTLNAWVTGIEVHPTNSSIVWVTYSNYYNHSRVIKTIDGGTSWVDYSDGLPAMPVNDIAINPLSSCDFLYLATDAGVFYRTNSMTQWECFDTNLPNMPIMDLELDPYSRLLRCATFGRGVWQTSLHPSDFRNLSTTFEYKVDCYLGKVKVKPLVTNPAGAYDMYTLWENNPADPGNLNTTGDVSIESIAFWGYNTDANGYHLFSTALDPTKNYYVVHGVWGDCISWEQSTIHNIELVPQGLSPNFTYSVNCTPAGLAKLKVTIAPQPAESNPFYQFDLYEYATIGNYGSAVLKDTRASWQQANFPSNYVYDSSPLTFSYSLNSSKKYYIKHGIWNACQSWTEKTVYDIVPPLCPIVVLEPGRSSDKNSGLEDNSIHGIDVHPNPTSDVIYVDRGEHTVLFIDITDQDGKVLFSTETVDQVTMIDLSKFAPGMYYVRSRNDNGIFMEKIIKN